MQIDKKRCLTEYVNELERTCQATANDDEKLNAVAKKYAELIGDDELTNNIMREFKMRIRAWMLALEAVGDLDEDDNAFLKAARDATEKNLRANRTTNPDDYKEVLAEYAEIIPPARLSDLLTLLARSLQYALFCNKASHGKTQINDKILDFTMRK